MMKLKNLKYTPVNKNSSNYVLKGILIQVSDAKTLKTRPFHCPSHMLASSKVN
jgi:hypothetical protein